MNKSLTWCNTNKVKIFVIILEYWLGLDGIHDLYHV